MKRKFNMNNPYHYLQKSALNTCPKITKGEIEEQEDIAEIEFHRLAHIEDYEILTCVNGILEERIERSGKCYY